MSILGNIARYVSCSSDTVPVSVTSRLRRLNLHRCLFKTCTKDQSSFLKKYKKGHLCAQSQNNVTALRESEGTNMLLYNKTSSKPFGNCSFQTLHTQMGHSHCMINKTIPLDHRIKPFILSGNSFSVSSRSKDKHQTKQKITEKVEELKDSVGDTLKDWKEDRVFTVPNALTFSRIILSPILGYMVLNESYSIACGMFVYAGLTDLADGWIARTFPGQSSAFGSYLDPLADKFLVSILFLSLTAVNLIPIPLTALVISRDVALIGAGFFIRYKTLPPPKTLKRYFDVTHATAQLQPTFISKLNTAVQLGLVATTLAAPVFGYVDHAALHCIWYLTAGTTVASGITYMFAKDTFKILRQTKNSRDKTE